MTIYQQIVDKDTLLLTEEGKLLGITVHEFDTDSLAKRGLISQQKNGRGQVYFFQLPKAIDKKRFALRHYCRGGMMAKVSFDKFFYSSIQDTRCYQEMATLQYLLSKSVNVPTPVAAKITRTGLFYRADLVTEVIEHTKELHEHLLKQPLGTKVWEQIGSQVKAMHGAMVRHDDINVKNILIQEHQNKTQVYLIDFDKCSIEDDANSPWQSSNIERFKRSILKQYNANKAYFYSEQNWDAFMLGYTGKTV